MTHYPLTDPASTDSTLGFFDRRECVEMNLAFAQAMLSARERGQEQFTIGPKIDNTAILPTHYPAQPTQSLMSSSSATCLDCAMGGEMPGRLIPTPSSKGYK